MICGTGLDLLQSSDEFLVLSVALEWGGIESSAMAAKHWVHKKCSGMKCLAKDPDYRCTQCQGTAHPLDSRPHREVQVGPDKLEEVVSFCYLGDMLSAADGCELSTTTRVKIPWKKFKSCYRFFLPATSLSRHVAMCTGVVCRAQCSMAVRLGH